MVMITGYVWDAEICKLLSTNSRLHEKTLTDR